MNVSSHRFARLRCLLPSGTPAFLALLLALPGGNGAAQVGDPTVTQVAGGASHTCALTSAGAVKCWGWNRFGQLGNPTNSGTSTPNDAPLDVQTLGSSVVAIAAGYHHTCALTSAGAVKCWGLNRYGQLGSTTNSGTDNANDAPFDVQTLGSGVVAIAAGYFHTCALTSAGAVKCWGFNRYGQLGSPTNSGTDNANDIPFDVQALDSGVVAIAAGERHTCALTSAGAVKCWGWNIFGQLGNPTNSSTDNANDAPLDVQTLGSGVIAIAAGERHTCALTSAGAVKCWGWNRYGQLGSPTNSGTDNVNDAPLGVQTLDSGVIAIMAGESHICALISAGAVKCWGRNYFGQLGSPTNLGTSTPNDAPLDVQTLSDIQPAGQSIAFAPPASLLRGPSLVLSATATSGEEVVFDTWTPDTCTLDGDTLTATATELCGVRASQPGSDDYAAAPQQLRLIRILRNDALTLNVSGQGSVEVSPDPATDGIGTCTETQSPCTAIYGEGDATDLTFVASPVAGWHLDAWSDDCTEDGADPLLASLVLGADKTCTATFAIDQHPVTASVSGGHGGIAPPSQTVNHGDAAAFTVTPDAGYHAALSGDTCAPADSGGGVWTAANITAACAVTASFTQNAAAAISVQGGTAQSTPVLAAFANALAVRVADAGDAPLQGIAVNFAAPAAGAGAVLSSASAVTDANGLASVTATANAVAGGYTVTASVDGVATPASFALENTPLSATLALAVSPAMTSPGGTATLTATLTGEGALTPTGSVDFLVDGVVVCAAVPVDADGIATCIAGPFAPGQHPVSANYSGDAAHAPAASAAGITLGVSATPAALVPVNGAWALASLIALVGLFGLFGATPIPRARG